VAREGPKGREREGEERGERGRKKGWERSSPSRIPAPKDDFGYCHLHPITRSKIRPNLVLGRPEKQFYK